MKTLILFWFKVQIRLEAPKVLSANHSRKRIESLLFDFRKQYDKLKAEVPKMPTLGGSVMVHLAAMSVAFYQALMERVPDEELVTKTFYEIAWSIYSKMGKWTWAIAGLTSRNDYSRLLRATKIFRKFPFNSPSYQWWDVPNDNNIVAFDCLKCPVAEYFRSKGLSEFCAATWCALDYSLAEMWNATLERTGSIAGGASKCDFRWKLTTISPTDRIAPGLQGRT